MDDGQNVEDDEEFVGQPEQVEDVAPGCLGGEHVQDAQHQDQKNSGETWGSDVKVKVMVEITL